MSFSKDDRVFHVKSHAISDAEFAKIIGTALRKDFGELASAVKTIGQMTRANPRAIRNWYEARNVPSSGHLLVLARSSPSILQFILEQIGGRDLADAFGLLANRDTGDARELKTSQQGVIYTDKLVSINGNIPTHIVDRLNQRQRWFVGLLQQNQNVKADDIAIVWGVNARSAWRDVAGLTKIGLVKFTGAKKNGKYEII